MLKLTRFWGAPKLSSRKLFRVGGQLRQLLRLVLVVALPMMRGGFKELASMVISLPSPLVLSVMTLALEVQHIHSMQIVLFLAQLHMHLIATLAFGLVLQLILIQRQPFLTVISRMK